MYNNINVFQLVHQDRVAPYVPNQGTPTTVSDFLFFDNTDRYIMLAKSKIAGTSKVKYWLCYQIDNDAKDDLGLSCNDLFVEQPFEVEIVSQTNFESHEINGTGAKGIAIEVTLGTVDILLSSNHLHISN